jgi:C_GCAxxG_C_C family probable redox protein
MNPYKYRIVKNIIKSDKCQMSRPDPRCAVDLFEKGFNCCQSVLAAFAPDLCLDKKTALKAATAFGAGIARRGDTCGAVTGALLVIGLKHGRARIADIRAREKTYRLSREFIRRFKKRNRSILCRQLLGCNISTARGLRWAKARNLFKTLCPKYVKDSIEILGKIS